MQCDHIKRITILEYYNLTKYMRLVRTLFQIILKFSCSYAILENSEAADSGIPSQIRSAKITFLQVRESISCTSSCFPSTGSGDQFCNKSMTWILHDLLRFFVLTANGRE